MNFYFQTGAPAPDPEVFKEIIYKRRLIKAATYYVTIIATSNSTVNKV